MTPWRWMADVALALALSPGLAVAQALRDPTQPPPLVAPPPDGNTAQPVSSEPQLQSVLISTGINGRRVAVISGETVRVGDMFRDAKVVKITQTAVTLRQGREEQFLVMAPPNTARPEPAKPGAPKADTSKPDPSKAAAAKFEELFNPGSR